MKENVKQRNQQFLEEKKHRTALISITGIGRKTFQKCVDMRTKLELSWDDFWVNRNSIWQKSGINEKVVESIKNFIKEHNTYSYWESLSEQGISVIDELEDSYPQLLFEIDDSPPILFVKGKFQDGESGNYLWNNKAISVVGTRKMTSYGKVATQKIVNELILNNIVIISGFMYGVDVWAQQTAVKGGGKTIAVLGYGFDHIFPTYHKQLMAEMLEQGAVFMTEYPSWISPSPNTFPTRNRIVAGLSSGVVVAEAGEKSGSHITAQCALNYGREVFAIPGSIFSPYCQGTKDLIKQGAIMISSGQEIMDEMGWGYDLQEKDGQIDGNSIVESEKSSLEEKILTLLTSGEKERDDLVEEFDCTTSEIAQTISKLEINGKIINNNGRLALNI